MDFNQQRKKQGNIQSLGDLRRTGKIKAGFDPKKAIRGPKFFDCLARPWLRGDLTGVLSPTGVGKCLAIDTPILMFDGTIKKVQDVIVGDKLMGPDSKARTVMSLARGQEEMFEIRGTDDTSYIVNRSHILSLKASFSEGKIKKGDIVNISVNDYLEKSQNFKRQFKGYRVGVEFEQKETQFDPYALGVWLGDGTKGRPQVTNPDKEIIGYLHSYFGSKLGYKVHNVAKDDKCPQWDITNNGNNPFFTEIKTFVNGNNEKFINKTYLINSRENRLKLLAGILDTDGSLINNCFDICIKDKAFAVDFEYLCRSLGYKVSSYITTKTIKETGFSGEYYRFTISGDFSDLPMKIERKTPKIREQIKEPLNYGITVKSLGEGNYYGFTIDGDHLFLLGDFVVTHNTTWSLFTIKEILKNNPQGGVAVLIVLEQSVDEINEKWEAMTEDCPELADRLYIFSNYDDTGISQNLGISEIKYNIKKIKDTLNETVLVFLIDHLHLVNNNGSENFNQVCIEIKNLAKEVDAHGIVISQTTKANQVIDVPVPRTGCYNCSQYEWIMTNIISIFQPLKRVEHEAGLPLLGWQYSKIRYKGQTDKVKEQMNYLLFFDHDKQSLRELTRQEKSDFSMFYDKVMELRQNEEKFKSFQFDVSETIVGKDGATVKLDRIVGGGRVEDEL